MSNESHGKFVTFPLCWLAARRAWDRLLTGALGYGAVYYLRHQHRDFEERRRRVKDIADMENEARSVLGFTGGDLPYWEERYAEITAFEETFSGKTYSVRLPTTLLFESRDGDGLSEAEMRVHLAILSILGSKGYAKAGWVPIRYRAAGYLKKPPVDVPLLSRGQIDRAIKVLVGRGLWIVYGYTGKGTRVGERYWTNRMPLEKLVAAVLAGKKKRNDAYADMQRKAAAVVSSLAPAPALSTSRAP